MSTHGNDTQDHTPAAGPTGPRAGSSSRIVVVGAGISGLAAAWRISRRSPGTEVIVLDGATQVGGKLRVEQVGGLAVDVGAESVLARRPEAVALIKEIGLADDLVHPAVAAASVLSRGVLHRLPAGTVMGVPADRAVLPALAGLLTGPEVDRVAAEPTIAAPPLTEDVDVASWVAGRMGRAVVDRLVEPLLGGVYAGHAGHLSLQATVPALWLRAQRGGPLLAEPGPPLPAGSDLPLPVGSGPSATGTATGRAAGTEPVTTANGTEPAETGTRTEPAGNRNGPSAPGPAGGPVFAGVRGGVGRLAGTLAERLLADGVRIRTGTTVRGLRRTASGWQLETGPASAPQFLQADAVVLAVPPTAAARLLSAEVPFAAAELNGIETASVVVVAAAVPAAQLTGLTGSGVLIPPVEGTAIKAATFSSVKWDWISGPQEPLIVRMSLGRAGEERTLQRSDEELAELAVTDLAAVIGRRLHPIDTRVVRWGGGLPQYAVGHLARIERLRTAVAAAGKLAICGAALDGVGIPACIAAADRAVAGLLVDLGESHPEQGERISS